MGSVGRIASLVCLCLLGLQLAGPHVHVEIPGTAEHALGSHLHLQGAGELDHDGEKDVSAVTLGAPGAKLPLFLVATALSLFALLLAAPRVALPPVLLPPLPRRARWRPPLRAPPRR